MKIALFGFGRMGQAMVNGWHKRKIVCALDIFDPITSEATEKYIVNNGWRLNPVGDKVDYDVVIIAVKPQSFGQIEADLRAIISKKTLLLSIMAGITIEKLQSASGALQICRVMPNTPAQIGEGVSGYIGNIGFTKKAGAIVQKLLSPLGMVVKLDTEKQIDTITAVSGSGPAYLFLMTEALASAAASEGLSIELSEAIARQTIIGAAALLKQSSESPIELRKAVTSPGGTTEAALDILTGGNAFGSLLKRAVESASKRSRDLGKLN